MVFHPGPWAPIPQIKNTIPKDLHFYQTHVDLPKNLGKTVGIIMGPED